MVAGLEYRSLLSIAYCEKRVGACEYRKPYGRALVSQVSGTMVHISHSYSVSSESASPKSRMNG